MPPTPTNMGLLLPPVMDSIYKRSRDRKVSISGPLYVVEERKVSKSVSLSSLIADEGNEIEKQVKSNSVLHIKRCGDDLALGRQQRYRHSECPPNKKQIGSSVFDYNRILREERKEFEFRLANIPKASGHLNDYLIKGELACGQFGRVYLAEDAMDKKMYAIKTICKKVILRNNLYDDVVAERDYLHATNSPFIVSLIHHFEDARSVYLVEEYVSNGDIYEHLKHTGSFSEELARFYISQVVLALEYLHNVNLIYRDLKPENVMVASDGYIKLVDFGFVKRVEGKTNSMVGTPAYMSPEQILHKSYDKAVDWWSLGILIYEMLAGCQITPFHDHNTLVMYEKITSKEVTFPSSSRFPQSVVRDLIKRLLKVNPILRLGTGINGSQDVKNHPWFTSINWVDLYRRNLTPPKKRNSILKSSNNSSTITQQPAKHQKVAALKESLLGHSLANSRPQENTIQNRRRFEKLLKIR